jgi:hypothetical protein
MRKPRKNYTPVEKVAILRRHLIDRVPVSDLCDEHQLSPKPAIEGRFKTFYGFEFAKPNLKSWFNLLWI